MAQNLLDSDAFSGTAGTALPTYNAKWTQWGNGVSISTPNGGVTGAGGGAYNTSQTWTNDQWAEMKVENINQYGRVMVRCQDVSGGSFDGYSAGFDPLNYGDNKLRITRHDNGGLAAGIGSASASDIVAGDIINLEVVGNTLTARVNGTIVASGDDSTYPTGGNPGMWLATGVANQKILSTWNAGSVGAGAPPAEQFVKVEIRAA